MLPAPRKGPWWRAPAWWLVAFAIACAWDRALWLAVTRDKQPRLQWLEDAANIGRFLTLWRDAAQSGPFAIAEAALALAYVGVYGFGRLYIWILLAVFFLFRNWAGTDGAKVREGIRRAVFVLLVPGAAGFAAELLKPIARRMRPEHLDGWYAFKPWPPEGPFNLAFWSGSGLGLASSHAAVAFGGALAAGLLLPRWRTPLLILATLCAASRVAVGAHFLSDVVAGTACAFAAYKLLYAWDARNNGGKPLTA